MYNLAPRFGKPLVTGTPDNLGPDRYIICDSKHDRKNWAPFLSTTDRKFTLGKTIYTHALHNPEETVKPRIKGGASLQNRAARLVYSKDDAPGPTTYDPKKPEKGCKYKAPLCHGKGRLYVCRVPYTILGCGPSVPTHIDENGYDIDYDGNLIKVPPDEYDRTLGPAKYHIPRGDFCFTTRKYHKGCQWSKSKSKRKTLDISDNPGPGSYDPKLNPCIINERDEYYRQMARLFSFAPRFTEGQMLKMAQEDLPGPGHYNVDTSSIRCPKSLSINPIPFVVGVERFGSAIESDSPGPGAYEICDCPTKQKQFSIKDVPFGYQSSRFRTQKAQDLPGPTTYDLKGSIEEKLCSKRNRYSTTEVPFCQMAERKIGFTSEESAFLPGPGYYDVEEMEIEKQEVSASFFKSRTSRFRSLRTLEDASPASYNISVQFNKNRNRTSHNTGKVPFQSSQSRAPGRKTETPGPADYIGQGKIGEKGLSISSISRFKAAGEDDSPGPGSYTIHPSVGLSIYKAIGTHNLRLKESVMRTKLRCPPGATWQNWVTEAKKKKKLRWFSKPTIDYYRHCVVIT